MCVCVCLCCSHSDDSDRRACLSVGVWFPCLASSTHPCQFSFSGCLLLVCDWTCCVTLIKDLKGQEAFGERGQQRERERSAKHAGETCVVEYLHSSSRLETNWRIVAVTPTVCPAHADPQRLFTHSLRREGRVPQQHHSNMAAILWKRDKSWFLNF